MPGIDYEVEYNNRDRVPEHATIFERWKTEAAAYRAAMAQRRRAELGLKYGPGPRQTIDLFLADGRAKAPIAVFVHGGYWRSLDPSFFSQVAAGLAGRGATVAVVGYDLCPQVTVAAIADEIRQACLYLWRRYGRRMLVFGHSAGGHLAACMLVTDWHKLDPAAPDDLVPAAYAISGVFDLTPLIATAMNADLRLDAQSARAASPLFCPPPKGKMMDAVVGGEESAEFLRQSRTIADEWGKAGTATRFEPVPGRNHFTVLDPLSDPKSAMADRLWALATLCQNQ